MVDIARTGFPQQMHREAHPEATGTLEGVAEEVIESVSKYTREKPISTLLCALGVGFFLGWRLKPW